MGKERAKRAEDGEASDCGAKPKASKATRKNNFPQKQLIPTAPILPIFTFLFKGTEIVVLKNSCSYKNIDSIMKK